MWFGSVLGSNFKNRWTNETKPIYIIKLIIFLGKSHLLKFKTRPTTCKKENNLPHSHQITNTNSETLKLSLPHVHSRKQPSIKRCFDFLFLFTLKHYSALLVCDFWFSFWLCYIPFSMYSQELFCSHLSHLILFFIFTLKLYNLAHFLD